MTQVLDSGNGVVILPFALARMAPEDVAALVGKNVSVEEIASAVTQAVAETPREVVLREAGVIFDGSEALANEVRRIFEEPVSINEESGIADEEWRAHEYEWATIENNLDKADREYVADLFAKTHYPPAANDNCCPRFRKVVLAASWTPSEPGYIPNVREAARLARTLMEGETDWMPAEDRHDNDNKPLTLLL